MKLLFVVEHFPCVSETFVVNQITGLIDRGHDVEIYALGAPDTAIVHPNVVSYGLVSKCWRRSRIPNNRLLRVMKAFILMLIYVWVAPLVVFRSLNHSRYGQQAASLYLFYSILPFLTKRRRFSFDAIHCHFGDKGVLANKWRDMGLLHKPLSVVFHAHEMCMRSKKEYLRFYGPLFESDALILPISYYWRELLISWGARPERTLVHRAGIDCRLFAFKPQPLVVGAEFRILTVARLVESKGIEYGIRAVARIREEHINLRYCIVGDGPLRTQLEDLVNELGVGDVVDFVGAKAADEVAGYLQSAHVFLSPHVTAHDGIKEGIPGTITEAMAAGVLVVTTRHSGIPELVEDGASGLLAEERDVDGLVECLLSVVHHPERTHEMLRAARRKIEDEFNIDPLNDRLSKLLMRDAGFDSSGERS